MEGSWVAHLFCQLEGEVLQERGGCGQQAHLCQVLAHTVARALSKGEVALGPLAVACTSA